jgi:5-methylcytosine-specific restriction endonuclease McrA
MLLIQETIDKYGYDPTTLTKGSHKKVIFECPKCKQIDEIRVRYFTGDDYICKYCTGNTGKAKKEKIDWWKKRTNDFNNIEVFKEKYPNVLIQETYDKYGYFPHEIGIGSHKPVLYKCFECGSIQETRIRYIKSPEPMCSTCTNKKKMIKMNTEKMSQGLAPNGLPLGYHDKEKYRVSNRNWYRKFRSTDVGKAINRLRVGLKRIQNGYSFKDLPYTPQELGQHIIERLEAREYKCPLCNKPFDEVGYDIDHKIPLTSVDTPEDVLELFALSNLDVLCPECNQFVKRNKIIDY